MDDKISPIHPGEILIEEFLKPMGISQHKLAVSISVPPRRINEIVHGKRRISADIPIAPKPISWNECAVLDQFSVPL